MACGQAYPSKPIRIVTSGAGGNPDIVARLVAPGMSAALGKPIVVDNHPDIIAAELVSKANPDGYILLVAGGTFIIGRLMKELPYDPVREFSPVILLVISPNVLVVHPSLPVNSVKGLIALAKSRPGQLNYASSGVGGAAQLATELFKSMAGALNIVRVNFRSMGAGGIEALIAGEVQLTVSSVGPLLPHIKSGKLRALAVTTSGPSQLAPGLPTVGESVPGYVAVGMTGIFAPSRTPVAVINRLNLEIMKVLGEAEIKEKFLNAGSETAGNSPQEFAAAIESETAKWGKVIKDAGIKAD